MGNVLSSYLAPFVDSVGSVLSTAQQLKLSIFVVRLPCAFLSWVTISLGRRAPIFSLLSGRTLSPLPDFDSATLLDFSHLRTLFLFIKIYFHWFYISGGSDESKYVHSRKHDARNEYVSAVDALKGAQISFFTANAESFQWDVIPLHALKSLYAQYFVSNCSYLYPFITFILLCRKIKMSGIDVQLNFKNSFNSTFQWMRIMYIVCMCHGLHLFLHTFYSSQEFVIRYRLCIRFVIVHTRTCNSSEEN